MLTSDVRFCKNIFENNYKNKLYMFSSTKLMVFFLCVGISTHFKELHIISISERSLLIRWLSSTRTFFEDVSMNLVIFTSEIEKHHWFLREFSSKLNLNCL